MPSHVSSQPPNRSSHFVALLSSCSWKSISSAVLLPAIAEGNGEKAVFLPRAQVSTETVPFW